MLLLLSTLGFFLQIQTSKADPKEWMYQKSLRQNSSQKTKSDSDNSTNGTFNQVIDHFSTVTTSAPTFKQRYFIDSTYAQDSNSPVIYYLCGEGACEGATSTTQVNELAKKIHAHRIALEHRYYGTSQPFETLETKNLAFLSMEQAIEDLASFQTFIQTSMNLKGKWITMGGSYAGELSAFYRLKHPELVVGALASSGPVLAKADFFEYDRHVARVAGPACLSAIQKVVADVEMKLLKPESAAEVKKLFHSTEIRNNVDFLYVIADMAAIAIQYGYQKDFCKAITDGVVQGTATKAYADVGTDLMESTFGMNPVDASFQGAESVDPSDYSGVGLRAWMYQSCTQFGFWQVANSDKAESSRSAQITQAYHDSVCERLFGIKKPVDTAATNRTFYDQLFNSSVKNIYFTNGANDPWLNLSLTEQSPNAGTNPNLKLFTIAGASHCDDLGSRASPALTQARTEFRTLVGKWLSE